MPKGFLVARSKALLIGSASECLICGVVVAVLTPLLVGATAFLAVAKYKPNAAKTITPANQKYL
jgi:hypothetical protein